MEMRLEAITKSYGRDRILSDLSLRISSGQCVSLLGPSGCGKTTLLRVMAGLEPFEGGRVHFDGVDTQSWTLRERRVGFVFQHYALFKHMRVAENISFGLRMLPRKERPSAAAIRERTAELLALVQLEGLGARWPHQLSGGQRQRVALARALAVQPRVLLLDEPFGALDAKVRRELRAWLRQLQKELAITTVLVTHDQEEAFALSDHIALLHQGRIEAEGAPEELYEKAQSPFARHFLSDALPQLDSASPMALAGARPAGGPGQRSSLRSIPKAAFPSAAGIKPWEGAGPGL